MTKKQRTLEIIERLKKEYPDAACTLDYDQAWKLLVSVRLAAQCTDARVNIVVEELFAKYPSVAALAAAEPEDSPAGLVLANSRTGMFRPAAESSSDAQTVMQSSRYCGEVTAGGCGSISTVCIFSTT